VNYYLPSAVLFILTIFIMYGTVQYIRYCTIEMSDWFKAVSESEGFDWDNGNVTKNAVAHQVSCEEAEQIFVNRPLFFIDDHKHSQKELRMKAFGQTDAGKLLTVSFTMREQKIRVISARDMDRRERNAYEAKR